MVESRHSPDTAPIEVEFTPLSTQPGLPLEVLRRSAVVARRTGGVRRQRVGFHQLIVCTSGNGTHWVDFEPHPIEPGTVLRTHPGQVQRYVTVPDFEAEMVLWPVSSHPATPGGSRWYPGGTVPTRWWMAPPTRPRVLRLIDELRFEQKRFDGSPANARLMQVLLHALLIRLVVEIPDSEPSVEHLPRPYLAFRQLVEERLTEHPSVVSLAAALGYSTRTLDRACHAAAGRTAKQLLDDRVALEARRLLTHTTRPISQIGAALGFDDPSNFSKFVRRQLGSSPREVRHRPDDRGPQVMTTR